MIEYVHKSLGLWPHAHTPTHARRNRHTFKAGWSDTLAKLSREIENQKGKNVVIASLHKSADVRMDGMLRSNARVPEHPGIEISFDVPAGANPQAIRGRQLVRQYGSVKAALFATHPDTRGDASEHDDVDYMAVLKSQEQGRMVLATDCCETWEHNVRSIALTLEALRAVDRYGATQGRQYAGFKQLTA